MKMQLTLVAVVGLLALGVLVASKPTCLECRVWKPTNSGWVLKTVWCRTTEFVCAVAPGPTVEPQPTDTYEPEPTSYFTETPEFPRSYPSPEGPPTSTPRPYP